MKFKLIEGAFDAQEAQTLINQLIEVKIKFLESKISSECTEEDIKNREQRIKSLQLHLSEVKQILNKASSSRFLDVELEIK